MTVSSGTWQHYITNDIFPSSIYIHPVAKDVKDVSVLLIYVRDCSVFDNYLLRQFIKQCTTVTRTMSDYTFNEWMDRGGGWWRWAYINSYMYGKIMWMHEKGLLTTWKKSSDDKTMEWWRFATKIMHFSLAYMRFNWLSSSIWVCCKEHCPARGETLHKKHIPSSHYVGGCIHLTQLGIWILSFSTTIWKKREFVYGMAAATAKT